MPNEQTRTQSAASLKEIGAARAQHAEEMQATYGAARLAQQELQGRSVASEEDKEVSVSATPVVSEEPVSVEAVEPVSVEAVEPVTTAEVPHSSRIAALARARVLGGGSASAGKTTVRDVIASRTIGGVSANVKQAISDRLSKGRTAGKPKLPRVVG